jgi:hypothetical protein
MKNYLTLLLLLFSLSIINAQTIQEIKIKGITTDGKSFYSKRLSDVTINIYDNNNLIEKFVSNKKGKFEFEIGINSYITIEFVHEDFITKRIAFNTSLPKLENEIVFDPFNFEIMMLDSKGDLSEYELDFPVTKIEFSKEIAKYVYNQEYTEYRMEEQKRIIALHD